MFLCAPERDLLRDREGSFVEYLGFAGFDARSAIAAARYRRAGFSNLGYMPAFRNSMSDGQIGELGLLFAPAVYGGQPRLEDVRETVARIRASAN
jgi:hypothetical protein